MEAPKASALGGSGGLHVAAATGEKQEVVAPGRLMERRVLCVFVGVFIAAMNN